ncbi:MAG: ABC transporter ATP-binding protein/permease [Lentimicrobiaceae bacterium]|nr:ABC transporter ATP-binding protein/permease [Lentimicrobiaceae bacterium]
MSDYKNLFQLLKPYGRRLFFVALLNVLSVLFSLFTITLIAPFLSLIFGKIPLQLEKPLLAFNSDAVVNGLKYLLSQAIQTQGTVQALLYMVAVVIVFIFLNKFFNYSAIWILTAVRTNIIQTYRNKAYNRLLILPLSYYSKAKKGDIISRVINDVQDIDTSILQTLQQLLRDPLMMLLYLFTLFFVNYKLTLFVFVLLPVAGILISRIQRKLKANSMEAKQKQGLMNIILEESIYGLRVIKAFHTIGAVCKRFFAVNEAYNKVYIKMYRRRDLSSPMSEFFGTLTVIFILLYGSSLVLSAESTFSAELFITYIALFVQVINPAKATVEASANLRKGFAAVHRIEELLDEEEVIVEQKDALPVTDFSDSIRFENVSFSYGGENVLNNLNFSVKKGTNIAICGLSGSGKSTLADLLMRFYDPTQGKVLFDEKDIKTLKISDLRAMFGMVNQETILFNDTVYNNIVLGLENIEEKDVIEAAEIANAYDFITKLENGFHTNIGDRGAKLSGGQKQRICIARAVLRNPAVLILDEATSALDSESERAVQTALDNVLKSRTSIVIAHRLSTIANADEILVLDRGAIAERGTHQALIAQNGIYAKMIETQS